MLIYARNQTFCSKSVKKIYIFFVAFLAIILEKNAGIKIIFLCIYCFMNFLCISLFFDLLFLLVFSVKFVADTF